MPEGAGGLWTLDSESENEHTYELDIGTTDGDVSVHINGDLKPDGGGGGGGSGDPLEPFDVKVADVDLDADTDNTGSISGSSSEDEAEEEDPGVIVQLNNNWDEGATDGSGNPVADKDHGGIVTSDNQLMSAQITGNTRGESGTLTVETASNNVKAWHKDDDGNITQLSKIDDYDDDKIALWLEGVSAGEDQVSVTFEPDSGANNAGTSEDAIKVSVLKVADVDWRAVNGGNNLDDNNPDFNGKGKRLFPGSNSPTGATHIEVECAVTLNKAIPPNHSIDVHVNIFDVDDPTSRKDPIDDNDTLDSEGDNLHNGGDNRPSPPGISPSDLQTKTLSGGDQATIVYELTAAHPGNNFKVLASTNKTLVQKAQVDVSKDNGTNGANSFRMDNNDDAKPSTVNQSPLLSVWRRLHLEIDSMGNVPSSGADADDTLGGDVPDPAMSGVNDAYHDAYVHVVRDASNDNSSRDFEFNYPGQSALLNDMQNWRGTPEKNKYWSGYSVGIFESHIQDQPDPDDNDPNDTYGLIAQGLGVDLEDDDYNWFAMEVFRDLKEDEHDDVSGWDIARIVAHELGHDFVGGNEEHSDGDPPGDIMWAPSNEDDEPDLTSVPLQFREVHIDDIRDYAADEHP